MSAGYLSELEEVRRANGGFLLPEKVVEFAAAPATELHNHFKWDNDEAGHLYRLDQARGLIRAVVRIIPNGSGDPIKVRAYLSLPSDRFAGAGYRSIDDVAQDRDAAAEALTALMEDLERLRAKYVVYRSLMPVVNAISDAATKAVSRKRRRQ